MDKKVLLINGTPRSGTSAIGARLGGAANCAYRFQPLFSYALRERAADFAGREGLDSLVAELEDCTDPFIRNGMPGAQLEITENDATDVMVIKHVRYHNYLPAWIARPATRLLCVIRDPRACIYSQVSIVREWQGTLEEYPDWINAGHINGDIFEYFGLAGWLRFCYLAEMLQEELPERVRIVRYEDFCRDNAVLEQAMQRLALPIAPMAGVTPAGEGDSEYAVGGRSAKNWRVGLDARISDEIEAIVTRLGKAEYLCD